MQSVPNLTGREIEVLRAWVRTDSKGEAARALNIAPSTVNTHVMRIRAKYAAAGRPASTKAGLVARALQDGIVLIEEL